MAEEPERSSVIDAPSTDDGLTVSSCRFVVDAVHPQLGAVFLFYCASENFDPFYVVLVDAQSRRKRVPVGRKALSLVRRIRTLHIVPRATSSASLPSSNSTSAASSRSSSDVRVAAAHGITAAGAVAESDALSLWQDVLLSIARESTGQCDSTFTAACQRVLHSPDDVRRWYEWSCVFAGGDLPVHLALRRLELRTSSGDRNKKDVLLSPHSEFGDGESFVATCDPLALHHYYHRQGTTTTAVVASSSSGAKSPQPLAAHEALCVLSPPTPARASDGDITDVQHEDNVPGASLSSTVVREAQPMQLLPLLETPGDRRALPEVALTERDTLASQRFRERAALHLAHRACTFASPMWLEPMSACAAPVSLPQRAPRTSPWTTSYL